MRVDVDLNNGLLVGARFLPSPNFDERPEGMAIDLIVIHNISLPPNEFGGSDIDAFFTNTLEVERHPYFAEIIHQKVSCHCLIRRDGSITQYVPFDLRAWHAGESSFQARTRCNDFSIGIELEGADEIPYTPEQYESLRVLIIALLKAYPEITLDRIVGHSTIAPLRKTDPGPAFDWKLLRGLLEETVG
jgi:N-acetyl-anhydromuramoyl-L-alanine amidase